MAVHTLGNTTAPSAGSDSTAAYNEIANHVQLNMPANGYITNLHAYFGVSGGTSLCRLLLIDGVYNVAAQTGQFFVGSTGWQSQTITPFFKGSGNSVTVGWFVPQGLTSAFGVYSTGTWVAGSVASPTGISNFVTPTSGYFQGGLGWYITWIDPLSISSVSPAAAGPGQSVTVSGAGFVGGTITGIDFNGTAASGWVVNSDTSLTVSVPAGATTGSLNITSDHGNDSTPFTVYGAPTITSFTPGNGPVGTSVTITGTQFDAGVTAVKFNGTSATFTVNSATQITAKVPAGATTGTIFVQNNYGSATSSGSFTVNYPPTISGITPSPAPPGASVTISGTYFVGATSVTFNGVAATFTVKSQTQITATVPSGAGSGNPVVVTTPYGSASYSGFLASSAYSFDGTAWQTITADGSDGTSEQVIAALVFDGTNWQQIA